MFRDISLDYETKEAIRIARLAHLRAMQDKAFKRNAMIRQKIAGTVISLLSVCGWWFFSEKYNQFELGVFVPCFLCLGFYLLLTDERIDED